VVTPDAILTYSGVASGHFTGDVSYFNALAGYFTRLGRASRRFQHQSKDVPYPGNALLDTGGANFQLPPFIFKEAHELIPGSKEISQELYHIPCYTSVPIAFRFGTANDKLWPIDAVGIVGKPIGDGLCRSNWG
jgi:hypothetical protein